MKVNLAAAFAALAISFACLAQESRPDQRTAGAWTPLQHAALMGDADAVRAQIAAGANVDQPVSEADTGMHGMTPLTLAVKRGSVECVRVLLDARADATLRDAQGETALHHAADGESLEIVRAVLDAGGDVSAQDASGNTPLMRAASRNSCEPNE